MRLIRSIAWIAYRKDNMKKKYEVQTKFTYGWENVWHDEDGNLEYFDTKKEAMEALKENVDDWNNDPNTTERYSYDDYRVIYSNENKNKERIT